MITIKFDQLVLRLLTWIMTRLGNALFALKARTA